MHGGDGVLEQRPATPAERNRTVDHAHGLYFGERRYQRLRRERAVGLHFYQAHFFAARARLIHRVLGRPGHAADRHDRVLGTVHAVGFDQRRMGAAEAPAPFFMHLGNDLERVLHPAALAHAVAHEGRRTGAAGAAGERVDGHRTLGIEGNVPVDILLAEEIIDLALIRQLAACGAEGKIVAVVVHVHRQHHVAVLGNLVRHDGGVQHLLHRLAVHMDPADFAHRHRVLVPAPDALRRERIARDDGHHQRQAQARRA